MVLKTETEDILRGLGVYPIFKGIGDYKKTKICKFSDQKLSLQCYFSLLQEISKKYCIEFEKY